MGFVNKPPGLGDALFIKTQQKELGLLFGTPDRTLYANEIVRLAGIGTGAVHRELDKLSVAGLLTITRIGNQKHYQANSESPIFEELRAITRKTFGLADLLRESLSPLADRIDVAFVFGSVAAGTDTAKSDIDLFIIGRDLSYTDAMSALVDAEPALRRKVNPTLYSASELQPPGITPIFVSQGPIGASRDLRHPPHGMGSAVPTSPAGDHPCPARLDKYAVTRRSQRICQTHLSDASVRRILTPQALVPDT